MNGQPANLQAALVAVEPGTGRVLAYYGGHDGKGNDYAGFYFDENGEATGVGRHPPGSSFKVYTLAAALKAGISLNSYWQWTPHDMPGRAEDNPIRNASYCPTDYDTGDQKAEDAVPARCCESTIASLNVPFYDADAERRRRPRCWRWPATPASTTCGPTTGSGMDLRTTTDMSTVTPAKFDIDPRHRAVPDHGARPRQRHGHLRRRRAAGQGALRQEGDEGRRDVVYGETLPNPNQPPDPQPAADQRPRRTR